MFLGSCYLDNKITSTCLCLPQFSGPTCGINICNCSCSKDDYDCHMYCPAPIQKHPICEQQKLNLTTNLCHPNLCKNGGTCVIVNDLPTCR